MNFWSTIYNNTRSSIRLQTNTLTRLHEQTISGLRVIRPSDEPTDASQIQNLRSKISTFDNYADNIDRIDMDMSEVSTALSDISEKLIHIHQLLAQASSGIYNESNRDAIAEEVNMHIEQIVSLANTSSIGRHVFGGDATSAAPYSVERENGDGDITKVNYEGSLRELSVPVAPGVEMSGVMVGDRIFRSNDRQTPVFLGNTGAVSGSATSTVRGDVWLTVTQPGGAATPYFLSTDDGLTSIDVSTVPDPTNVPVIDSTTGKILYVDATGITDTGLEPVRAEGTYDLFGALINIRDLMKNERNLETNDVLHNLGQASLSLQEVMTGITKNLTIIGGRQQSNEGLRNMVDDLKVGYEIKKGHIENADIAQLSVELSRSQTLYEMTLITAGKLLSTSILDYIR